LGIPPAPRGVPQIEVTFEVDANGILHVSAKDLGTGKSQRIQVNATSGLSEPEIKRIIDESEEYRLQDMERREIAELKVNAEGLIYTTEKSLEEFQEFLSDADREQIRKDLLKCKEALDGDDVQKLRIFMKNLERSAYKIAAAMYEHM
jgi:molecular chaperone DnaK